MSETYQKKYHKFDKRLDAIDFQINDEIVNRYQIEIERNLFKNKYYQSIIDYKLFQRSQMNGTEYPILTESGFNCITDIDAIKTDEFSIPSYSTYYNKNRKNDSITFLELKQTKRLKTYSYWTEALKGDINERLFKGSNEKLAFINGLRKEIQTLIEIAKGSKIIVALTIDKTVANLGFETQFYEYNYDTKQMSYLSRQNLKSNFKKELIALTR